MCEGLPRYTNSRSRFHTTSIITPHASSGCMNVASDPAPLRHPVRDFISAAALRSRFRRRRARSRGDYRDTTHRRLNDRQADSLSLRNLCYTARGDVQTIQRCGADLARKHPQTPDAQLAHQQTRNLLGIGPIGLVRPSAKTSLKVSVRGSPHPMSPHQANALTSRFTLLSQIARHRNCC